MTDKDREKTVPNPGTGGTVSPMHTPDGTEVEAEDGAPDVAKAAVRSNQRLLGEHPEGSAPPLDRLTQDN